MKDYKENGKVIEITLDNGKIVKVATEWVKKSMKALNTDIEDVLLMFLEDNNYLENEELEELDSKAKKQVKNVVKSTTERKKVVRERKPNPDKEYIIGCIAEYLKGVATNVNIENVGKLITFTYNNKNFKFDLVETRKPKEK